MKLALAFWTLLMVAMAALFGVRMHQRSLAQRAEQIEVNAAKLEIAQPEPHAVADFTLIERSGRLFTASSLRGQVWIASFFFTACPGECMRMNSVLSDLQPELAERDVRLVSITVDPENDTPSALVKYADHYHADPERWLFLTNSNDEPSSAASAGEQDHLPPNELGMKFIQKIAQDSFQLSVAKITHSSRLVVVDQQGLIRGTFKATDEMDLRKLKRLLGQLADESADRADEMQGQPNSP